MTRSNQLPPPVWITSWPVEAWAFDARARLHRRTTLTAGVVALDGSRRLGVQVDDGPIAYVDKPYLAGLYIHNVGQAIRALDFEELG